MNVCEIVFLLMEHWKPAVTRRRLRCCSGRTRWRHLHCSFEARQILADKRNDLKILAEDLLDYETLSGDEIKHLLNGSLPCARTWRRRAYCETSAPGIRARTLIASIFWDRAAPTRQIICARTLREFERFFHRVVEVTFDQLTFDLSAEKLRPQEFAERHSFFRKSACPAQLACQ